MPILITGLFAPSGGAGSFDLYAPEDIQAGSVNVVLQAVAGGAFKGGSDATSPAGEIVAQVKTTTGAPTHSASLGTLCWNSVDQILYTNNNGATGWTAIGAGGGTNHNLLDGSVHPDTLAGTVQAGDLVMGNATPKWARLAKGTAGYVLKAGATILEWGQVAWSEITGKPSTFPPDAHHTSHENGGADPIKLDDLAAPDDNTDLNVSTAAHGLCPKAPNDQSYVLCGMGGWNVLPAHGSTRHTGTIGYAETTIVLFLDGAQTVGTKKKNWNFYVPWTNGATIKKAILKADTGPTGAAFIVDINKNGTTIWTTQANRVQIAAGATVGTQTTFDVTALALADILTVDVDQIGSTVAGSDVMVELVVQTQVTAS